MVREVIVIGGGFAGLRAAVDLADAGVRVTVLEGRVGLGGRARSFIDPATGEVVDNGQHLFLAGYRETLEFLKRLGTEDHLVFQRRLKVSFVRPGGKLSVLNCPPVFAPWHLFLGLAGLSSLSWRDKLGARRVFQEVNRFSGNGAGLPRLDEETVEGWLTRLGQSRRIRDAFWYPVAVATLNEDPSRASALGWVAVLKTIFGMPWPNARLGMACVGLSDLYATAARRIIEEKGGQVRVNCPVATLEVEDSRVRGVRLADGQTVTADAVVSALPPSALAQILPPGAAAQDPALRSLQQFSSSPIISINLWFDEPITQHLFVGFIGTRVQWLFNKEAILAQAGIHANYVTLILSAAHSFIDRPKQELVEMALEDLKACLPRARRANLIRSQVVREREATISLSVGMNRHRPGPCTGISNLFLAGDWTATGLPATIESAVLSGRLCAEAVLECAKSRIRSR